MCSNSETITPKFGELWLCYLPEREGSIQSGYRPVFILSNDKNNTYAPTVNVIPLTTKMNKRKLPVHVELWNYKSVGLTEPSTMMVEQITTTTVKNLDRCIGRITDSKTFLLIQKAIAIQFPIMNSVVAV